VARHTFATWSLAATRRRFVGGEGGATASWFASARQFSSVSVVAHALRLWRSMSAAKSLQTRMTELRAELEA
jgi:hypothetical protein